MSKYKKILRRFLAFTTPDGIMDLMVENRWDSAAVSAVNSEDSVCFDRNGTMKINPNNADVKKSFEHNIEALTAKRAKTGS